MSIMTSRRKLLLGSLVALLIAGAIAASTLPGYLEGRRERPHAQTVVEQLTEPVIAALEGAQQLELISLFPYPEEQPPVAGRDFHRYLVLGSTTIADDAGRRELIEGIYASIVDPRDAPVAGCFSPRHGVRTPPPHSVELLICFECVKMQVYFGADSPHPVPVTEAGARTLNAILDRAGIPREESP